MSDTTEERINVSHRWTSVGIFFSTFAIVVFVATFGYGYFELSKVNVSLAHIISGLQRQLASNQLEISGLKKSLDDVKGVSLHSQELSVKQEQMISDWQAAQKGDLDKWYVAEAQYLVRLANDHLMFTHNIPMALTLLRRADQVLGGLNNDNLMQIRREIASNITDLQAAPEVDVSQLYLALAGLDSQLDQLTLPQGPIQNTEQTAPAKDYTGLPWWKVGLNRTWDTLSKIVVVRYNGATALPLIMPDEKVFLYQNLHAQLEAAMWAVLHRNAQVYQASLTQALNWVRQYFQQDTSQTQLFLQRLQWLQSVNITPATANLSSTLNLFDNYLAKSGENTATPAAEVAPPALP